MDLYEDSFKLQEMIASDIQSSLSECILSGSQQLSGGTPSEPGSGGSAGTGENAGDLHGPGGTLTDLAPAVPVDPLDPGPMDEDDQSWMNENTSQLFGMDFENMDQSLLVNPQTGLPVNFPQAPAASPVISSSCTLVDSALELPDADIKMPSPQEHPSFPYFVIQQQSEPIGQNEDAMASSPSLKNVKAEPKAKKEKTRKSTVLGGAPPSRDDGKSYPKPAYSYSCLIAMALKNSQSGSLPVNEIYNFMM